jgi:hypothetical protein
MRIKTAAISGLYGDAEYAPDCLPVSHDSPQDCLPREYGGNFRLSLNTPSRILRIRKKNGFSLEEGDPAAHTPRRNMGKIISTGVSSILTESIPEAVVIHTTFFTYKNQKKRDAQCQS